MPSKSSFYSEFNYNSAGVTNAMQIPSHELKRSQMFLLPLNRKMSKLLHRLYNWYLKSSIKLEKCKVDASASTISDCWTLLFGFEQKEMQWYFKKEFSISNAAGASKGCEYK